MGWNPVKDIGHAVSDIGSTIGKGAEDWYDAFATRPKNWLDSMFHPEKAPEDINPLEPKLPSRSEVITNVLSEQLKALEKRRLQATLTTSGQGATDEPQLYSASQALIGS